MNLRKKLTAIAVTLFIFCSAAFSTFAQSAKHKTFHVIAFYSYFHDLAHISFVHDANKFFPEMAEKYNFTYDTTQDWSNLNAKFLAKYQVVLFLDSRPQDPEQRKAFEEYMKNGGGWLGFHFAGFALTPSEFNSDWDWYHYQFLGSGQYKSNTWHPKPAILRNETGKNHPVTKDMPETFKTSPNEWYRWEKDLRQNPDIRILFSIDSTSFPLGNGPKQSEIWHSGYYPVVWTNKNYKMVYFNMGHNDMDYDGHTNATLSHTFDSAMEAKLILEALIWAGTGKLVK
ncbi:MAG TPA: ThuA domain-containing protein [Mucilaginibacter sp.]|nr:ThuA domain-containing protein [Mucilaginibacter sp.]